MINLCRYAIETKECRYERAEKSLGLIPRLGGEGLIRTLLGYDLPMGFPDIPPATKVIVPCLAAPVSWALASDLVPYCVPRSRQFSTDLSTVVCDELELAPESIGYSFPRQPFQYDSDGNTLELGRIQRVIIGRFNIHIDGLGLMQSRPDLECAVDFPSGRAWVPRPQPGMLAMLVPNIGSVIRAASDWGLAVLVPSPLKMSGEVDLYRVR